MVLKGIENEAPEGGWGWAVVFGSFMVSVICDGFVYTTGILYVKFLEVYGESEAITTMFCSIMTGMLYAMGPLTSGLTIVYGCRTISILGTVITVIGMLSSIVFDSIYLHCLTLGVITGAGLGLSFLPQILIVTQWFHKRLSLAIGIAVCGTGIGIAIFAVLTEVMVDTFGWKGSMLIMSGFLFTNIFFSSLFRKPGDRIESRSLKSALKEIFNFKILREILFLYYGFAIFLNSTVYFVPIIFLKDHIKRIGIGSDADAVRTMVIFGLSDAFGRLLFGYIAGKGFVNRIVINGLSIVIAGLVIGLIATFGHNMIIITIGIIIFGIAEGAYVCLYSVVIMDLFGVEKVSNVIGLSSQLLGLGALIGPPLISKMVDEDGGTGYRNVFYISSSISITSGVLLMFLPLIQRKFKIADN